MSESAKVTVTEWELGDWFKIETERGTIYEGHSPSFYDLKQILRALGLAVTEEYIIDDY